LSTRFHFACAFVRMQSHARMLQPSSSGVMHAYVKERARDGTGTAAAARARLHTRNARTGTHGTGCACRSFHEPVPTSTLCRASTRTACYSTSDVSEDTELRTIPGVSQHHSLPRTTADARHATGQAGAHSLPTCTNPASCMIFKPLFSHL
jgi:hypothetical protein